MNKVVRSTQIISLAEHRSCPPVDPSTVVLKFNEKRIDIGAYCYSVRDKVAHSRSGIKKVDLSSLCSHRVAFVDLIIRFFFSQRHHEGLSMETTFGRWGQYKIFVEWCDSRSEFPNLMDSSIRRQVVRDFCAELQVQHRLDPMATNKYSYMQMAAIKYTSIMFSDELVGQGIPKIYINSNIAIPTAVPEAEVQSKSYAMCQAVYIGFSRFFMDNIRYPFSFELPVYLGGAIWVFPCMVKFISPFNCDRQNIKRYARSYNFDKGTIRSISELEIVYKNRDTALSCRGLAVSSLLAANADPFHFRRVELANHAVKAFMNIFQANTGMNLKQVISLPWGEEFEVGKADQGFRVVKWRAGGVSINFRTTVRFIKIFEGFLEFRSKLLQGRKSATLFFSINNTRGIIKFDSAVQVGFERFIRKIDSNFVLVKTRQWRSAKSDSVIRNNSVSTVSGALQNTQSTVVSHYIEGSEIDQKRQFKSFFEALSKVVVSITHGLKDVALAKCESPGTPLMVGHGAVVPDCKSEMGCLFCESFRVHASEVGIRKLVSCHYFVQRISYLNPSDQSQDDFYLPVLRRIDEILNYISKISPEMNELVKRVRESVYDDFELDSYWSGRIEALVQVGYL
ncbi:MAG: hypothetical protein QXJ64_08250 [Thermosphaera sp.]